MSDDKTNRDHEPDKREQENCADDLIAGETHGGQEAAILIVHLRKFDPGVIGLQNLFDVETLFR